MFSGIFATLYRPGAGLILLGLLLTGCTKPPAADAGKPDGAAGKQDAHDADRRTKAMLARLLDEMKRDEGLILDAQVKPYAWHDIVNAEAALGYIDQVEADLPKARDPLEKMKKHTAELEEVFSDGAVDTGERFKLEQQLDNQKVVTRAKVNAGQLDSRRLTAMAKAGFDEALKTPKSALKDVRVETVRFQLRLAHDPATRLAFEIALAGDRPAAPVLAQIASYRIDAGDVRGAVATAELIGAEHAEDRDRALVSVIQGCRSKQDLPIAADACSKVVANDKKAQAFAAYAINQAACGDADGAKLTIAANFRPGQAGVSGENDRRILRPVRRPRRRRAVGRRLSRRGPRRRGHPGRRLRQGRRPRRGGPVGAALRRPVDEDQREGRRRGGAARTGGRGPRRGVPGPGEAGYRRRTG